MTSFIVGNIDHLNEFGGDGAFYFRGFRYGR
jgi:hypothetical protein